jgi:excisionase family DNA binding protein
MPLLDIDAASIPVADIPAALAALAALQTALAARLLTTGRACDSPSATSEPERLLTVSDVARILGFARGYVYELVRAGHINAIRAGKYVRIRPSAIEQFLARQATGLDTPIYKMHSGAHEGRRNKALPQGVRTQADTARKATGSERDNPVPLGARRGADTLRNGTIAQAMDPASSKPEKGGLTDG